MQIDLRSSAFDIVRRCLGPSARRIRREIQWRTSGADYSVHQSPERLPYAIASHRTPLIRALSGLDMQLQRNKVVNLCIAAGRLDGIVLEPGQTLSFWKEVRKPTTRRGYLQGLVLNHGTLGVGTGGGLCQMTNLLYWLTLHTPLVVVERWRHSYDVFPDASRTQPFGSGATCAWPVLDLQIENPTTVRYRLSLRVTETHLEGAWRADEPIDVRYHIEERGHRFSHEGPGRFVRHNEIWRIEIDPTTGEPTAESLVAINSALMMYEPFLPEGRAS